MATFACGCGYEGRIPDTAQGRKLRCPRCTNVLGVAPGAGARLVGALLAPTPTRPCPRCNRPMKPGQPCEVCEEERRKDKEAERERLYQQGRIEDVEGLGRKGLLWAVCGICLPVLSVVGAVYGIQSLLRSRLYRVRVSGMAVGAVCILGGQIVVFIAIIVAAVAFGAFAAKQGERMEEQIRQMDEQLQERDRMMEEEYREP